MGMGKKSAPAPAAPAQEVAAPTVVTKSTVDAQADDNAAANALARSETNKSATLLQSKDDEAAKTPSGFQDDSSQTILRPQDEEQLMRLGASGMVLR